jgi:hypothetical protein
MKPTSHSTTSGSDLIDPEDLIWRNDIAIVTVWWSWRDFVVELEKVVFAELRGEYGVMIDFTSQLSSNKGVY